MASSSQDTKPAQQASAPEPDWSAKREAEKERDNDYARAAHEFDRRLAEADQRSFYLSEALKMYLAADVFEGRLTKELADKTEEMIDKMLRCKPDAQASSEENKRRYQEEEARKQASSASSSSAPPSQDAPERDRRMSQPEREPEVEQHDIPQDVEEEERGLPVPSGLPPQGSAGWEFPLSRAEKQYRVLHVQQIENHWFEKELLQKDQKVVQLEKDNLELKKADEDTKQKQEEIRRAKDEVAIAMEDFREITRSIHAERLPAQVPADQVPPPSARGDKKTKEEEDEFQDDETFMERMKGVLFDLFTREPYNPNAHKKKVKAIENENQIVQQSTQES